MTVATLVPRKEKEGTVAPVVVSGRECVWWVSRVRRSFFVLVYLAEMWLKLP
jgi:hypothetical protein